MIISVDQPDFSEEEQDSFSEPDNEPGFLEEDDFLDDFSEDEGHKDDNSKDSYIEDFDDFFYLED